MGVFGDNVISISSVGSTNEVAAELLETGPAEGTVVSTDDQVAGKGLGTNSWHSEPGMNLTFSLILYPNFLKPMDAFKLNAFTALGIAETVEELTGKEVKIKWPNDVLADDQKISGILIRNHVESQAIKSSVIGIGFNVNQQNFGDEKYGRATSLKCMTEKDWDRTEVMQKLLARLEFWYTKLREGQIAEVDQSYLAKMWKLNEETNAVWKGEETRVKMKGLESNGRLIIEHQGEESAVDIKEVQFL